MVARTLISAVAFAMAMPSAWTCSTLWIPARPTPEDMVKSAEIIVHVRAEGLADEVAPEGTRGAESKTRVTFRVLKVLKGKLSSAVIRINGNLEGQDDPNDRPVPYDFIRPGGRKGNCYALGYRKDAEYLLLLNHADSRTTPQQELTPYWHPLFPTNEQLFAGADDPWFRWVIQQIPTVDTP